MNKNIVLTESDKNEILMLKSELLEHIKKYSAFKQFISTAINGVTICNALLNNDYDVFINFKLKYTRHTADKMRGLYSLSTYKKTSKTCQFLKACGGICAKCYADRSLSLYETTLKPTLIYNTLLLKYIDIDAHQIPYINETYFRFESFSDIQSDKHFNNLIKICNKNKYTIFTLWTKSNLKRIIQDLKIKKLPKNLNIVLSEFNINKVSYTLDDLKAYESCINTPNNIKYFIVYDNKDIREKSGFYQCKLKCIECLKCYKKQKEIITIAEGLR